MWTSVSPCTTGVHYLQRYVLRHVVANHGQETQRMSEAGAHTRPPFSST